MKSILALLAAGLGLLSLTACGQQSAAMTNSVDVDIAVRAEPEPLAVGASTLIVTLTNVDGSRVDGAMLRVHGNMDHAGMTPVDREVNESANGEYHIPFEWTMGGGWIVTITAQLPDNGGEVSDTVEFFVEAVSSESVINRPASAPQTADAGLKITYEPDSNPAVVGESSVTITLADVDGQPVNDALVEVVGTMAHAGMMPVSGKGVPGENGQYVVPLQWTMVGDWMVIVTVTLPDGSQHTQQFDQEVIIP